MKRTNRKKESRGLPGGPHEQFTYVTGVFSQDMYHVPKAQKGIEGPRTYADSAALYNSMIAQMDHAQRKADLKVGDPIKEYIAGNWKERKITLEDVNPTFKKWHSKDPLLDNFKKEDPWGITGGKPKVLKNNYTIDEYIQKHIELLKKTEKRHASMLKDGYYRTEKAEKGQQKLISKIKSNVELFKKYKKFGIQDDWIETEDPQYFSHSSDIGHHPTIRPYDIWLDRTQGLTGAVVNPMYERPKYPVTEKDKATTLLSNENFKKYLETPQPTYRIHDYMKMEGMDPSPESRDMWAKMLGMPDYKRTAEDNEELIKRLKEYKKNPIRAQYGGNISTEGYKRNSPDVNKPNNIIMGDPSGTPITMGGVDFAVKGVDNLGNEKIMYPEEEHHFPGSMVYETPLRRAQTGLSWGGIQTETSSAQGSKIEKPETLNERLYRTVTPIGYDWKHALKEFQAGKRLPFTWNGKQTSFEDFDKMERWRDPETGKLNSYGKYVKEASDDHWNYYLNKKHKYNTFTPSKYRPTKSTGEDIEYMQFNQDDDIWETADKQGMLEAKVKVGTNKLIKDSADGGFTLKDYTLSKGKDDKGHYISYYDKVDFAPSVMGMKIPIEKFVGNPYDFYGRMYYDPKTGQRIEPKESRGISRGVTGIDNLRTKQEGGEFQRLVKKYTTKGWASLNPQEQQFYRETYQKGGSLPSYQLKGSVNQKTLNPDIYGQRVLGNTPIDYRDPKLAQKLEDFKEISAQNKKEQAVLRAQLKREDDIRNRKFINEDISYKDDPDFFDRSAVLPGSNGKIKYSDYVKKKVYEGTHAYNPSTGALTKLQTPVSVDPLTSARSKKGAQQARIYADNPLAKKPSDITEEEMGAISHADRFKDLENLYKNPLWYAPAAIATAGTLGPAVLANPYVQAGLTGYGVYDAKTHSIPGAVQATKDGRYLDAAGNTGMAALDLLPIPYFGTNLIGEGKNLLKNVKNSKAFNRRAMDWTNDRPGLREDIREEAIKYYKLATSKENYARAKALDDKEGTKYVEGLDALKKQWLDYNKNVNSDKLPFNTHVIENPETGAGGYSGQLPPELKYKTGLHEFFGLGPKSGIDNRGVFLFDDATRGSIPRILPHEIKHHYTFANEGDDFYTKNPYYTQYSDLIHTPKSADEAGDPFLADMLEKKSFTNNPQTKSDYYRNPWEVDAYAFTNLKNHFVKEGITNSVFDKITVEDFYNFQKFGSKKGINKNFFKSIRKDKVKEFVKLWNESVYTAAPAIGAAGLMSNTLENNTNEGMRQKYRRGGRIKAQDGGSTDNKQFEIYQNYINGVFDEVSEEEAKQVYDKLNRMYYTQAKQQDMSPANFIMTHVIGNK